MCDPLRLFGRVTSVESGNGYNGRRTPCVPVLWAEKYSRGAIPSRLLPLTTHKLTELIRNDRSHGALLMPETDKVLLGADTVLADGSIINKVGSSLMALSAAHHRAPVHVCAEEFKQLDRQDCELEQMDPAELGLSLEGVDVRNTWFERIPSA